VSLNRRVEVTKTYKDGAADARGAARMASVNVPDRFNELTDRTVRSVDAAMRAEIGPYRKSRIKKGTEAMVDDTMPMICSQGCFSRINAMRESPWATAARIHASPST
jgi:hypothetical protein